MSRFCHKHYSNSFKSQEHPYASSLVVFEMVYPSILFYA
jgi:hypothetical protein